MPVVAPLVWILSAGLALAQEPAVVESSPALVEPLWQGEAWREERAVARYEAKVVSLARSPDGSAWLAGLSDGTLLRSMDGARTWSRVLRAAGEFETIDDEELLLDAESVAEESAAEQAEAFDDAIAENTAEPANADAEAQPERPNEQVEAAGTDDLAADTRLAIVETVGPGASVWFSSTQLGLALAGRGDGLWRSIDGGVQWARVDNAADARCFLELSESGTILAGTGTGLRISPSEGEGWIDVDDATDGAAVVSLARVGGKVFAATSIGLYASADTLRWNPTGLLDPTTAILGDPGWEGGMWVATSRGVLRSDDGGLTFSSFSRQSLRGTTGLAPLLGPAHLVAWGSDGVWETTDGAVTWHPVSMGLRDPHVLAAVVVDGRPIIATSRALWRLVPSRLFGSGGLGVRLKPTITESDRRMLGLLMDVATSREGLDLDRMQSRRLAAKAYLPRLTLDARGVWQSGRTSQFVSSNTSEYGDFAWVVTARACFGGCASGAISDLIDVADEYGVAGLIDASEFDVIDPLSVINDLASESQYVIDGEIVGEDSEALAATNVAQKIRKYRLDVGDQVAGAWSALIRLRTTAPPDSLPGSVAQVLQVQELEARLDLYTDGAYTRAKLMEP